MMAQQEQRAQRWPTQAQVMSSHVGEMPHHDVASPPCSFLWKKWKNLCVGDVVCLSKDSIVPVSPPPNLEHPWGRVFQQS